MKAAALLLALAWGLASAQSAPEWKLIGQHEAFNMYINARTLSPHGKYRKGWLLTVYKAERNDAGTPRPYKATRTLTYFDCAARKVGSKEIAFFDGPITNGTPIETAARDEAAVPFADAAPGTFMDSALAVACSGQAKGFDFDAAGKAIRK